MDLNRLNLLHLEQFYEIAKAGSVSTGARKLRISQPALSKAIRLLEESLDAKLFERTKRGVHLTGAGTIAFEHAGKIFAESARLRERIENENSIKKLPEEELKKIIDEYAKLKKAYEELRSLLSKKNNGEEGNKK